MWPFSKSKPTKLEENSSSSLVSTRTNQGPGKGKKCPNCERMTFHNEAPVHICSQCGTVGYYKKPGPVGSGSGEKCFQCRHRTLHTLFKDSGKPTLKRCSKCASTIIIPVMML